METSSLRKNQPHLEAVLGPLSAEDDANMRAIFDEVDGALLELARHLGRDGAGWGGTGLELSWMVSGQTAIGSHIGACIDGANCVDFIIELRPSWYFGERSPTLSWEIETTISADCQHAVYRAMETVHSATLRAATAMEAAVALRTAARQLLRQGMDFPLAHWLALASDTTHLPGPSLT
ncbi:hypothetical protein [Candidatus Amarolinea dominans]|uniref:hypothetical protein n=1 Tax=Candidatus Amarolinea dominans TaxID=3140696 RepID=UPI00313637AE|nr:hypothetical protein [Anaerolineae bacterium]